MKDLNALRAQVSERLGDYRKRHVLSTEQEAAKIAAIYIPEAEETVRISALLHDITKEYTTEMHCRIFAENGIEPDSTLLASPKTLHALTAALLIPKEFPEYATKEVVSAVKHHTTGCADMSVLDCVIYLADYMEPLRSFEDCVALRSFFWNGIAHAKTERDKEIHLYKTMVRSFDLSIKTLLAESSVIAPDTFYARNAFLHKLKLAEENYEQATFNA